MVQSPTIGDIMLFTSCSGGPHTHRLPWKLEDGVEAAWTHLRTRTKLVEHVQNGYPHVLIRGIGNVVTSFDLARPERERLMNFDSWMLMPEHERELLIPQWDYVTERAREIGARPMLYMGAWGWHLTHAWETPSNRLGIIKNLIQVGEHLGRWACPVAIDWIAARFFDRPTHPFCRFIEELESAGLPIWTEAIHGPDHPNADWLNKRAGSICFERRWRDSRDAGERLHTLTRPHIRMYGDAVKDDASEPEIDARLSECIEHNWIPAVGTLAPPLMLPRAQRVARAQAAWRANTPRADRWTLNPTPATPAGATAHGD